MAVKKRGHASRHDKPMGVADWEMQLTDKPPKNLRVSLPTIEQIEAEFAHVPGEPQRWPPTRKGVRRGR